LPEFTADLVAYLETAVEEHCGGDRGVGKFCTRVAATLEGFAKGWAATAEAKSLIGRLRGDHLVELRSTTKARNATQSVNKVLLQQAAAEHLRRFGKKPCTAESLVGAAPAAVEPKRPRRGGAGHLALMNSKMAAYKSLVAVGRPMTQEEVLQVRQQAAAE